MTEKRCKNCNSNEFTRLNRAEEKCDYCGTIYEIAEQVIERYDEGGRIFCTEFMAPAILGTCVYSTFPVKTGSWNGQSYD